MEEGLKKLQTGIFKDAAYIDIGSGFPIMLVHGFPADHNLWNHQIPKLKKQYRLLLPDIPGTGHSPLIDPISIEDMGDFFNAILEQEKIDSCILIGHSMGGYATLAFAEKHPQKLKGFGLFHSSAFADDEEKKKGRKRSITLMEKYGPDCFLKQMLPNLFGKKFREKHRDQVQKVIRNRAKAGIGALVSYYHAMWERPERTQVLRASEVPVLFFIGKEDIAAPMQKVLQQVSLPAVSEVHLFENVGHLGMLEIPATTSQVLNQFIQFCLSGSDE